MPRGKPETTPEERFLRKILIIPCIIPELTDCHIWNGGKFSSNGITTYGQIKQETYGTRYAHQWACHHWNDSPLPIEPGMCVKHLCDIKLCVNPEHLQYGTLQENIQEMIQRNPDACGKVAPTDLELETLKQMIKDKTPRRQMSTSLGHSRTWIDRITKDYL